MINNYFIYKDILEQDVINYLKRKYSMDNNFSIKDFIPKMAGGTYYEEPVMVQLDLHGNEIDFYDVFDNGENLIQVILEDLIAEGLVVKVG